MNEYWVKIPVDACIAVCVDAESEEEAKEKALTTPFDITLDTPDVSLECFEPVEKIIEGNVCYASQWEIEVE